ncbi:MAG: hypothetical protein ACRDVE_16915, partial [Actinocrinis sp.]
MSLRARIALAGGLVVFAALLAASLVLYPLADRDLYDQLDNSLVVTTSTAPKFAVALKQKITADPSSPPYVATAPIQVGDTLIQFFSGAMVAGGSAQIAPLSKQDVQVASGDQPAYFQSIEYRNQGYRLYTAQFNGPA